MPKRKRSNVDDLLIMSKRRQSKVDDPAINGLRSFLQVYLNYLDIKVVCRLICTWSQIGKQSELSDLCKQEKQDRKDEVEHARTHLCKLFEKKKNENFTDIFFEAISGVRYFANIMNWNISSIKWKWMEKVVSCTCAISAKTSKKQDEDEKQKVNCFQLIVFEHAYEYFMHIHTLHNGHNDRPLAVNRRVLLAEIMLLSYVAYPMEKRMNGNKNFPDEKMMNLLEKEILWMKDEGKFIRNEFRETCLKKFIQREQENENVSRNVSSMRCFYYEMYLDSALNT